MNREEYFDAMGACGFPDHEIELFWRSADPIAVLEAAINEGERDLTASAENFSPSFPVSHNGHLGTRRTAD